MTPPFLSPMNAMNNPMPHVTAIFSGCGIAAMILSGMGPLHFPATPGGKLFAGLYAIYCGFAVLVIAALAFAPVIHRVLHRFHLEEDVEDEGGRTGERPRPRLPR